CTACKRIAVPAACITASCTSAEGGSTATMNCPCSRIRLRTTVSACARSSSVGSCCNARIASSIFSFPCKPLSFFSSISLIVSFFICHYQAALLRTPPRTSMPIIP
ncbi:MAG TPA: hypothetical protein DGE56_08630, partial [Lachnospiraceae bacterium]|nr:hypothetical protein [Lachnospiraceae bacterium]